MEWFLALIIKIFTGWTLVEFSRGFLVNFFSSLVLGGGEKLFSMLKGTKEEEEQLRECLYTAINKHVKNTEIARYMREHDDQKYLDALKTELLTGEHTFAVGSDDDKILKELQKELSKRPFFTIRLARLYGTELCTKTEQSLDKLNQQIRDIQAIKQRGEQIFAAVQTLTASSGYSLNISDSTIGDFECPIPDTCFTRSKLVGEIKEKLSNKGACYIYGGLKTGKSILCCLVAQTYNDYTKVRIPLEYQNILSIKDIVSRYAASEKTLFIIDGIPYKDEAIILDLCHFINQQDRNNWLFLLNGRQPLSQFTTTDTDLDEFGMPLLSSEEVQELVPTLSQAIVQALTVLSDGSPMIAILMIQTLQSQGWPSDAKALYALFGFSPQATFNEKFRNILNRIIPDRDAVRLLNRLLLVHSSFTREQSRQLAAIGPSILLPDTCFDSLNNVAITDKGNGQFVITPSLAKTLTPDLLPLERKQCDSWLASQIISKKTLNELDVVRVLNYLIDGGEYDRAGFFFISCITKSAGCSSSYRLLDGIWIDLPLPKEMNIYIKILIRIQQIIVFCVQHDNPPVYPIKDLEELLEQQSIEKTLLNFSYQVLGYYYGSKGDIERSSKYIEAAASLPANPALSIFTGETIWMTLFKVRTVTDLFTWFDLYAKEGFPDYDFKEEMSNKAVSNICTASDDGDIESQLLYIKKRAEEQEALLPFVISAEANLIFFYGNHKFIDKAEHIYAQSVHLNSEFGKLLLNFAMGMCYYNNSRYSEAERYFKIVTEVQNIELNAINVLYSYIYYAAILSEKKPLDAVSVLKTLSEHPQFESVFVEAEKVLLYAELAFACWKNKEYADAVSFMTKVEQYIWTCRNSFSDSDKILLVKLSVLVSSCYGEMKGIAANPNFAQPKPAMFILINDKLKDEFSDFRVLATIIYLYSLQKEYLWDKGYSLNLLDQGLECFKGSVIETHAEYSTLFISYIPELLMAGRFDDVKYIISQSSRAVQKFKNVITHPEGAVLVSSLFYVLLYRLDCQIKGQDFEDSSLVFILSDFKNISPNDCAFASYLLDVIEGKCDFDVTHFAEQDKTSLLVFYGLTNEPNAKQWFVALQRMYVSLKTMNDSHTCGKFVETISTDIIQYAVTSHSSDFYVDNLSKITDRMKKYTLFERGRAALSGFYYLMKNPPQITKEVEELMEM